MDFRGRPLTLSRVVVGARSRASRLLFGEKWVRIVMNQTIERELDKLGTPTLDAIEVSGRFHASRRWRSYRTTEYPEFDLCSAPPALTQHDVVLCHQVLEHVV